jgi:hypothetical protein
MSDFFNPNNPSNAGFRVNPFGDQNKKSQNTDAAAETQPAAAAKFEGQPVSADRIFDLMAQQSKLGQMNVQFGSAQDFASAFSPEAFEKSISGIVNSLPKEVQGLSDGAKRALAEEVFLNKHLGTPVVNA